MKKVLIFLSIFLAFSGKADEFGASREVAQEEFASNSLVNFRSNKFSHNSNRSVLIPDFSAKGLNYEVELTDIFMGNFSALPFQREDMFFGMLFNAYISNYSEYCAANLPPDKIQLMTQVCASETITKNGFGIVINRTCTSYKMEPTGVYAAPAMYRAMKDLEKFQLKNVLSLMDNSDVWGGTAKRMGEMKAVHMDMAALIRMNGCNSAGLKQFEENLRLLALNKMPIRIEALIKERERTKVKSISANQDFKKLVEDLVYENSRQWNFNRYHEGSIDNVQILSKDAQQRPTEIKADYFFTGWNGKSKGSVRITFTNQGLPNCLYFSDFPTTCRSASRKITGRYAQGTYANQ